MSAYYNQPLNFYALMNGAEYRCKQKCGNQKFNKPGNCPDCGQQLIETIITCNLQQSIAQRIHLMLITNINEFRYDRNFGCIIWESDFETLKEAQDALALILTDNRHEELFQKQVPYILDTYTEIYRPFDS